MTTPRFELTSQRQKVSRLPTKPPGQPAVPVLCIRNFTHPCTNQFFSCCTSSRDLQTTYYTATFKHAPRISSRPFQKRVTILKSKCTWCTGLDYGTARHGTARFLGGERRGWLVVPGLFSFSKPLTELASEHLYRIVIDQFID